MNATAPEFALFILVVLVAAPILSGIAGVLIERHIAADASARARRARPGRVEPPPGSPDRANHLGPGA